MSATQLLRILQTLPACTDDDISDSNADEIEENMNRGSRCTNPFLSNEEDNQANFLNDRPELESSTFGNEFTNNHEDVPLRKPPEFAKTTGFRIDKHSVACELPELIVCYKDKESDFHVEDICIDEGNPDVEAIPIHKDNKHEFIYNSGVLNGDDDGMIEASHDTKLLRHDQWLRSSTIPYCYTDEELDSSNTCAEKLTLSIDLHDVSKDQSATNSIISWHQDWSLKPLEFPVSSNLYDDDDDDDDDNDDDDDDDDINLHPLQGFKDKIEEGVTFHFDTRKLEDSNPCGTENPESIYELPLGTESVFNQQDAAPCYQVTVKDPETRHVEGESSFSMAGVISELISCSRPMPFAGGISTRSDSSANSTRSFAFPTLETEYASSPVRMGNVERKRLEKQRRWRKGLLCCKF